MRSVVGACVGAGPAMLGSEPEAKPVVAAGAGTVALQTESERKIRPGSIRIKGRWALGAGVVELLLDIWARAAGA